MLAGRLAVGGAHLVEGRKLGAAFRRPHPLSTRFRADVQARIVRRNGALFAAGPSCSFTVRRVADSCALRRPHAALIRWHGQWVRKLQGVGHSTADSVPFLSFFTLIRLVGIKVRRGGQLIASKRDACAALSRGHLSVLASHWISPSGGGGIWSPRVSSYRKLCNRINAIRHDARS